MIVIARERFNKGQRSWARITTWCPSTGDNRKSDHMMLDDDGFIGTLVLGAFWALLLSIPALILFIIYRVLFGIYRAFASIGEQGREDREAARQATQISLDEKRECLQWLGTLNSRSPQVVLDLAEYAMRGDSGLRAAYNRYKAAEKESAIPEICRLIGNDMGAMMRCLSYPDWPSLDQQVELMCSFRYATRTGNFEKKESVQNNAKSDLLSQKEFKAYPILMLMEIGHPDAQYLAQMYGTLARHVAGLPASIEWKIKRERILRDLLAFCSKADASGGNSASSVDEPGESHCEECTESWQVLELTEGASVTEVKASYRDLAMVWHPDRFGTETLQRKAEVKMKELNRAYAHLTEHCS